MNEPFRFCIYGEESLTAYEVIKNSKKEFISIKYFLLCRAIEIFLKTFLLGKGLKMKELKGKYGHNISGLLVKSIEFGIKGVCKLSEGEIMSIKKLSHYYNTKQFEYMHDYVQILPRIEKLEKITNKMYDGINEYAEKLLYI